MPRHYKKLFFKTSDWVPFTEMRMEVVKCIFMCDVAGSAQT